MAYTEEDYARARMLSPAYAKKWAAIDAGNQYAEDFSGIKGFMEKAKQGRMDDHRQAFDDAAVPSDVDIPMRGNDPYDPSTFKGLDEKGLARERIEAMIATGNPQLIKQAESLMGAVQTEHLKPDESGAMPNISDVNTIQTKYNKSVANAKARIDSFRTMRQAIVPMGADAEGNPIYNPANDKALVYGFAKMLDPTGMVTDKDYKSAASGGGWADMIDGWIQSVRNGTLSADQRSNIINAASNHYNTAIEDIGRRKNQYGRIAADRNIKDYHIFDTVETYDKFDKLKYTPKSGEVGSNVVESAIDAVKTLAGQNKKPDAVEGLNNKINGLKEGREAKVGNGWTKSNSDADDGWTILEDGER